MNTTHHNRPSLFTPEPWAATLYLLSYPVLGTLWFALTLTITSTSAALSIVWIGLPLLVGSALIVRGFAAIERWRARLVTDPIPSAYREVTTSGFMARLKSRWSDAATFRDLAYLILMYIPLMILNVVIVSLWLAFLGMVSLPFWYWSIPYLLDDGTMLHGVSVGYVPDAKTAFSDGAFGIWVGDLPTAIGVAIGFFLVVLLFSRVVVGAARLHASAVRSILGPYVDPLGNAKRVLAEPGPLPS